MHGPDSRGPEAFQSQCRSLKNGATLYRFRLRAGAGPPVCCKANRRGPSPSGRRSFSEFHDTSPVGLPRKVLRGLLPTGRAVARPTTRGPPLRIPGVFVCGLSFSCAAVVDADQGPEDALNHEFPGGDKVRIFRIFRMEKRASLLHQIPLERRLAIDQRGHDIAVPGLG